MFYVLEFMKLLFVNLPPWSVESPPIIVSYLDAIVSKDKTIKSEIYDLNLELFLLSEEETKTIWKKQKCKYREKEVFDHPKLSELLKILISKKADIVCFVGTMFSISLLNKISYELKKQNQSIKILIGGKIAKEEYSNKIEKSLIDFIIYGEAENILIDVIKGNFKSNKLNVVQENNLITFSTKVSPSLKNINFPNYEKFRLEKYEDQKRLPIFFSRGCKKNCAFCSDKKEYNLFKIRDPKNVVDEIINNYIKYERTDYHVCDLIINGDMSFLERFLDLLNKKNIKISWAGQATIRKEMTLDLLKKLRMSGCHNIAYGVESFSDNVLKHMDKDYSSSEAITVIKNTKFAGINVGINLLVGFPGEKKEDIDITIDLLEKYSMFIDQVNSINIFSIQVGCFVSKYPDKFDIKFQKNLDWTAKYSNNKESRVKRLNKLVNVCKKNGLIPEWV